MSTQANMKTPEVSEPYQDTFYKNIGFKTMDKYVPMKYHGDE